LDFGLMDHYSTNDVPTPPAAIDDGGLISLAGEIIAGGGMAQVWPTPFAPIRN